MPCTVRQKQSHRGRSRLLGIALIVVITMFGPMSALTADFTDQQQLVDKARLTIEAFGANPDLRREVRNDIQEVKGVFIVPQLLRGAFVFGGRGGSGVLLVRDEKGGWSQPAFYSIGSVSFGFQAGADASQMVFLVRTTRGLEQFYKHDFKLGLDAGMPRWPRVLHCLCRSWQQCYS